jgi:catechol 2,3-dioxygenase-like lactoylglutathione lyase family enzyme/predicted enzyme related to lactoylglutathione lyase
MNARIVNLTILSEDSYTLARFYECVFHMSQIVTKRAAHVARLTDGRIGMDILPRLPGYRAQLDTFGVQVDDLKEVLSRVRKRYPKIAFQDGPGTQSRPSISIHDPAGNVFSLHERLGPTHSHTHDGNGHDRMVDHLALRVLNPEEVAEFYTEVLGLSPLGGFSNERNIYLSDGNITLVIIPWDIYDFEGTGITAKGLDHIGFRVNSIPTLKSDIQRLTEENFRFQPSTSVLGRGKEGAGRLAMFRKACPLGHHHMSDSDGLLLDVTD